jgi:hypothetical protein
VQRWASHWRASCGPAPELDERILEPGDRDADVRLRCPDEPDRIGFALRRQRPRCSREHRARRGGFGRPAHPRRRLAHAALGPSTARRAFLAPAEGSSRLHHYCIGSFSNRHLADSSAQAFTTSYLWPVVAQALFAFGSAGCDPARQATVLSAACSASSLRSGIGRRIATGFKLIRVWAQNPPWPRWRRPVAGDLAVFC